MNQILLEGWFFLFPFLLLRKTNRLVNCSFVIWDSFFLMCSVPLPYSYNWIWRLICSSGHIRQSSAMSFSVSILLWLGISSFASAFDSARCFFVLSKPGLFWFTWTWTSWMWAGFAFVILASPCSSPSSSFS